MEDVSSRRQINDLKFLSSLDGIGEDASHLGLLPSQKHYCLPLLIQPRQEGHHRLYLQQQGILEVRYHRMRLAFPFHEHLLRSHSMYLDSKKHQQKVSSLLQGNQDSLFCSLFPRSFTSSLLVNGGMYAS